MLGRRCRNALHPVTGQVKLKQPRDLHLAPTITYGNGRPIPLTDRGALVSASLQAKREALAAHDKAEEERRDRERLANGQGRSVAWPSASPIPPAPWTGHPCGRGGSGAADGEEQRRGNEPGRGL
jgi:hypothetical protein